MQITSWLLLAVIVFMAAELVWLKKALYESRDCAAKGLTLLLMVFELAQKIGQEPDEILNKNIEQEETENGMAV